MALALAYKRPETTVLSLVDSEPAAIRGGLAGIVDKAKQLYHGIQYARAARVERNRAAETAFTDMSAYAVDSHLKNTFLANQQERYDALQNYINKELINRFFPGKARYMPDTQECVTNIERTMGHQDVIITMGAGNVWELAHRLAKK